MYMARTLEAVWQSCLETIKQHVTPQSYTTWFEPIKPIKLNDNILTIQVPSRFFYEWLEENYVTLLRRTITKELGDGARLEYQITVAPRKPASVSPEPPTIALNKVAENTRAEANNQKPPRNPFVIPGIKDMQIEANLVPYYTFETYIEGECNQLARSAGIAIANNPGGTAFNPLVVYGGSGLGKTHLVNSIGNQVKAQFPNKVVLYVPSEKFTNQFIEAVKNGAISDFTNFYQLVDVLIVDDIQFFANKDRTQDIFFHTFNHLHQSGKQIILTSDRAPKDLEGMEERLLSRFKWGLTADLKVPDFETRMAILEKKLGKEGIEISGEVVEYIAYHIKTNVREMEGALISLMAHSSLSRKDIDIHLAKSIVQRFIHQVTHEISIEFIQKIVGDYYRVSIDALKGKTRKRAVVQARQICMFLAKQFTENSLKTIGQHFGGRDHSTVIHACQAVLNLMETDKDFHTEVLELQKQLNMTN